MLEKMAAFFERRLDGYDEHMLTNIQSAREFYPFTAQNLPKEPGCHVLDLGCGTGLELEFYYPLNPTAKVTGIDLSKGMLDALRAKFTDRDLELIQGSYFDADLGEAAYDGAVSVESLHHFTQVEKTDLYRKVAKSLKTGAFFILTDYFAMSQEEENSFRRELEQLKAEAGIQEGIYHFDTPLTVANETQALLGGGFTKVEILGAWGATATLRATK